MRKSIVFILALLLIVPAAFSQEKADFAWIFVGKIETPYAIWQQFVGMAEIQPIYKAGIEKVEKFFSPPEYNLPTRASMEEVKFFGIGTRAGRLEPELYVWVQGADKEIRYSRSYISPDEIIAPQRAYHSRTHDEAKDLPFPEIFKEMGHDNLFQMKFFHTSILDGLRKELAKAVSAADQLSDKVCRRQVRKIGKLLRQGKITSKDSSLLPQCPLKGNYSLNLAEKSASCDHELKVANLEELDLSGKQKVAFHLIKALEKCTDFTMKIARDRSSLVLQVDFEEGAAQLKKQFPGMLNSLEWFDDLKTFNRLSPQGLMHFVVCPDLKDLFKNNAPNRAQEDFPTQLFPEGTILISSFGGLEPFFMQMPPLAISLNMTSEKFGQLMKMLGSMGMPAQFAKDELYGTELEKLPAAAFFPSFNRQEKSGDSIYAYSNAQDKMEICLGENVALKKLAVDCGEVKSVQIWDDVVTPVKFAFAIRFDSVAQGILKLANQAAFNSEGSECRKALSEWTSNNPGSVKSLQIGSEIPEELLKCCPRGAIVIKDSKFDKISCAIHNFRSGREIETQFFNAAIPGGRWLRVFITKEQGKSRFIVDLKKAEVK